MSKIHIGPHTHHHGEPAAHPHQPVRHEGEGTYDREIDLRGIFWTGLALAVTIIVSCLLMWWLLKGFNTLDARRDLPPPALPEARRQAPPPEPRLEVGATENLRVLRAEEDNLLGHSEWINRGQGSVRVPIDVAMEVIARRGWGADANAGTAPTTPAEALGAGGAQTGQSGPGQAGQSGPGQTGQGNPAAGPQAPQGGALVQMSRQPGQQNTATQPGQQETPQPRRPPALPERR